MPHIADRPITLIRMPDGIHGERFFQKHWDQSFPSFVETITLFSESKDEAHTYFLCNHVATLPWLGQLGLKAIVKTTRVPRRHNKEPSRPKR